MDEDAKCTINCNYRTAAILYTLETWFVSGVIGNILDIIIIIISNLSNDRSTASSKTIPPLNAI
jgi:hypothetical protein